MSKREDTRREAALVVEKVLQRIAARRRTVDLHDIEMAMREAASEMSKALLEGGIDEVAMGTAGAGFVASVGASSSS